MTIANNQSAQTLLVPSHEKPHTVKNVSGYNSNVFPGKEEQMVSVCEFLSGIGFLPKDLVQNEVSWFYG
jgi:glutamate dehydrogenase